MGHWIENKPKGNNKPKGEKKEAEMYNKTTILGRIGAIYETKSTPSGTKIGTMSVAVSEKRNGEEIVQWFRVKTFNRVTEVVEQYLDKGCRVLVEGKMEFGKYTNKDNVEVNTAELVANSVQIIDFKEKQEQVDSNPTFSVDDIGF